MKIIHVGLGNFGLWWLEVIMKRKDIEVIAVVDFSEETHKLVDKYNVSCYKSLSDALAAVPKPDFIVNSTPPYAHLSVNREAFSKNIPVLMEKPISEDYADVLECLDFAKDGQKLMVAESYRYQLACMFVKEQLEKRLQNITGINLVFSRRHHVENQNYHAKMRQPMLIDIGVHHFDLLRFFTGKEVRQVYAKLSKPDWSWYNGISNVKMVAELDDGLLFSYDGSMDSHFCTCWYGHWTFTAENGLCKFIENRLHFYVEDEHEEIEVPEEDETNDKHRMLDEFMAYVSDGKVPQTEIIDQVKNAAIIEAAITSSKSGSAETVSY